MTGLSDPACLDFPEQWLCTDPLPDPPRAEKNDPSRHGSRITPPLGLSVLLHAVLLLLAMTISPDRASGPQVMHLTLLPAMHLPGGDGRTGTDGAEISSHKMLSTPKPPVPAAHPQVPQTSRQTQPRHPSEVAQSVRTRARPAVIRARKPVPTPVKRAPAEPAPPATAETGPSAPTASMTPPAAAGAQNASGAAAPSQVAGHSTAPGAAGQGTAGTGPMQARFGDHGGPRFLHRVLPQYPRMARRTGRQGLVVLRLTISARGRLTKVEVVQGAGYGFEEAALKAVRASTFMPAERNGVHVECSALLPIRFALKAG